MRFRHRLPVFVFGAAALAGVASLGLAQGGHQTTNDSNSTEHQNGTAPEPDNGAAPAPDHNGSAPAPENGTAPEPQG